MLSPEFESVELDNDVFATGGTEIKITRIIRQTGQSVYKINDKTMTRQQILEVLQRARVNPDGYNIILQGDIVSLVEMSTNELDIEEIKKKPIQIENFLSDGVANNVYDIIDSQTDWITNSKHKKIIKTIQKFYRILVSDTLFDQKSPALLVPVAGGWTDDISTDIANYRLN
mgnify:CR=1 FL=1